MLTDLYQRLTYVLYDVKENACRKYKFKSCEFFEKKKQWGSFFGHFRDFPHGELATLVSMADTIKCSDAGNGVKRKRRRINNICSDAMNSNKPGANQIHSATFPPIICTYCMNLLNPPLIAKLRPEAVGKNPRRGYGACLQVSDGMQSGQ